MSASSDDTTTPDEGRGSEERHGAPGVSAVPLAGQGGDTDDSATPGPDAMPDPPELQGDLEGEES